MSKILNRCLVGLAAFAITLFIFASFSRTDAVENQGVGAVPANPRQDNPRSSSIFVYDAKPGETINDALKVVNNTDKSKTISLYAVDSQVASDGAFACAQAVDDKKDVGSWIKLSKERVTLGAQSNQEVSFAIEVPKTADTGEHGGCLVIQDIDPSAKQGQSGIVLTFRSAIRVAITLPGDIVEKLAFLGVEQKTNQQGKLVITPSYKNEGNVSLDTDIKVELKSIFGTVAANGGGEFPVLPRSDSKFNFELDKPFWGGFYSRTVTTSYSRLSGSSDAKTLPNNNSLVFIAPQPAALIIELALLILLITSLLVWLKKREEAKQIKRKLTEYTVKKGDDIQSLAKSHSISWKLLAKINNLKAPYVLKVGDSIKIPVTQTIKTKR